MNDATGFYETSSPTWADLVIREESAAAQKPFDLAERTARFGEWIIAFAKKIPNTPVNYRLITQVVGAGTSVGANYCEADDSASKKEFLQKLGYSRKEARECKFFLRMIAAAEEPLRDEARELWREANELHLIFCSIIRKCQNAKNDK